jgi:hypothetical protein
MSWSPSGRYRAAAADRARAVRRRRGERAADHGRLRGGDALAGVVDRRDVRPQVLIPLHSLRCVLPGLAHALPRRTRRTASGTHSPARWTAGWSWTSGPRRVRDGVARRGRVRHALARHMIRRTALPSPRPWRRRPARRRSWRGSRSRRGVRSQSAPRAGRASSPRAPSVASRRRPRRPPPRLGGRDLPWPTSSTCSRRGHASNRRSARWRGIEPASRSRWANPRRPERSKARRPGQRPASRSGRPRRRRGVTRTAHVRT